MRGTPGELVLDRYRLEGPLGHGGFGRVYRGRQVSLDRPVALKASHESARDSTVARERFQREAVLVAAINHPNVVTYHDYGVDADGDLVLVMELLQGATLSEIVRRGHPVPLERVARWIGEAAAGLGQAHARGIVHRDVKPSNLFVAAPGTPAERLKVIDFGILRLDPRVPDRPRDLTGTDVFVGTPAYAAPEQMLGTPVDAATDQYALALVAYELLAGRRAFPESGPEQMMARVDSRPGDLAFEASGRRVPAAVTSALHRALSPAPGDRFPSVVAFARAMVEAAGASPVAPDREATEAVREPVAAADASTLSRGEVTTRLDVPADAGTTATGPLRIAGFVFAALVAAGGGAWLGMQGHAPAEWEVPVPAVDAVPERAVVPGVEAPEPGGVPVPVVTPLPGPPPTPAPDAPAGSPGVGTPSGGIPPASVRPSGHGHGRPPARPVPADAALAAGTPSRSGEGTLFLNADPWAEVEIDGSRAGRTPIQALSVRAGNHTVRFSHPKYGVDVVKLKVPAGETVRVTGHLPERPSGGP